jgi:hypothetical protein
VLCMEAECTRLDDPLGRKIGEMIWPEWFNERHWQNYRANPRTWSALFQQNPKPAKGGQFEADWFHRFAMVETKDMEFVKFGTSDWAVTELTLETHPDYTVHGMWGLDAVGDLWLLGGWKGMADPVGTVTEWLKLLIVHSPTDWAQEAGVIRRAIEPIINAAMDEADKYTVMEYFPAVHDKVANAASFRSVAAHGKVHIVKGPFGDWVISILCGFPFGRYDDAVDMCGLAGRMRDKMRRPEADDGEEKEPSAKPFTEQMWTRMRQRDLEEAERRRRYTE